MEITSVGIRTDGLLARETGAVMIDTTGTVWHIIYEAVALSIKLGFGVRAGRFTVAHAAPVIRVCRRRALQGPARDALAVDQRHAIGTHGLLLRLALIVLVGGITVRTGGDFVGNTLAVLKPSGRATVRWSGLKLASIAHRFPSGATSTAVVLRGAQDSIPDRAFRTALSGVRGWVERKVIAIAAFRAVG